MNLKTMHLKRNLYGTAKILKAIANHYRLEVLCLLVENEELSVSNMLEHVDLSQSALSQHLSKMRRENLVDIRRDAQTIYYRIANHEIKTLMHLLNEGFSYTE